MRSSLRVERRLSESTRRIETSDVPRDSVQAFRVADTLNQKHVHQLKCAFVRARFPMSPKQKAVTTPPVFGRDASPVSAP
jgi:hypothetical protein